MDHDHLPAISALLVSAPLAVLTLAGLQFGARRDWAPARSGLERAATAAPATWVAALLLLASGVVHLGLVPGHGDEPLLAASFAGAGLGLLGIAIATLLQVPRWRALAASALTGAVVAYAATRLAGLEGLDALGLATVALELLALGAVAAPVRRRLQ